MCFFPPGQLDSENNRADRIAERVAALEKRLADDGDTQSAAEATASEQRRKLLDRLLRQAAHLRDMLAASGKGEAEEEAAEGGHEEEECWEKTESEVEGGGRDGGGEGGGEEGGGEGVMAGSRRNSRAKSVVESELIGRAHARYWRGFVGAHTQSLSRVARVMLRCSPENFAVLCPLLRLVVHIRLNLYEYIF